MSDMDFAVNLGGGLYMDSNGNFHPTKPESVPVYDAPFSLPVDPDKVKNALEGAKKFIADATDQKNIDKFTKLGVPMELFDLLSTAGKIVGIIAPVVAVAAFAIDFLKLIGVFKSGGPSAFEQQVFRRFDDLERHVKSIEILIQQKDLRNEKEKVQLLLNAVKDYINQLKNTNPSPAQLENDRIILNNTHDTNVIGVANILNPVTWLAGFDQTEHSNIWPWMQNVLYTLPSEPSGAPPAPARMPAEGALRFDHRLMVPLACYAAESYLASIRGISPEYRTTGDYRENLREFALKLDSLAGHLRDFGLARTIYKPSDFITPILWGWEVEDQPAWPLPPAEPRISPRCGRWPVGALDLYYHNNAFFGPFLNNIWSNLWTGPMPPTKYASMDFYWNPPAKLERWDWPDGTPGYRITNPEECAAAANLQSEKDYADVLMSSGYFNLLHLAALYRNEATEPNKSQTVQGDVYLRRVPQAATPVTVKSEPILMTGVIESPASRQMQDCSARVLIMTQPIKRARPIEYRIRLRTLASIRTTYGGTPRKRWHETTYDDYQFKDYEPDFDHPGFRKLVITHGDSLVVDERLLTTGSSPREPVHREDTIEMKAHTFDWWIPVKSPFSITEDNAATIAALRSAGWIAPYDGRTELNPPGTMRTLEYRGNAAVGPVAEASAAWTLEMLWGSGAQDWVGEHREVDEATVQIGYKLDWINDQLSITLQHRPSDRNYIVYVVVEEEMIGTGQFLHTAIPVPANGQLTYVPQKFFDDEKAAWDKLTGVLDDFNRRYSESVVVGPEDPVIGWVRPGDRFNNAGLEHIAALAEQYRPDLLQRALEEYGHG